MGKPCQLMDFFIGRSGLFIVFRDSHMSVFIYLFSLACRTPKKKFTNSSLKVKAYFPLIYCFMKEENIIIGFLCNLCFLFGSLTPTLSSVLLVQPLHRLNLHSSVRQEGDEAYCFREKVSKGMASSYIVFRQSF